MKTTIYFLIAGMILTSCRSKHEENTELKNTTEPILVEIQSLQQQQWSSTIRTSGQFTTDDETILSFKSSGVIDDIYVKEGDQVYTGQILASLHLTEIEAQVHQAELNLEKSQRDFDRIDHLYKDSVATLEQWQNSKTAFSLAQEQLKMTKFNLGYSQIRAQSDGFILQKFSQPGQYVSAGTPVLLSNGAKNSNWILRVGLSDVEWTSIKLHDKALVELDSEPGHLFEAAVSRKWERVDPISGVFTVDITFTGEKPSSLATGLFGKAQIIPSQKRLAWMIPYEALMDSDGDSGYAFVTDDQHLAHKIKLAIGGIDKENVLVFKGLDSVRYLITSGSAYLTDGSPIIVK